MLKVTNKNTLGESGLEMMQKSKFLLYQVFPINRNIFMFNQYGLYPITFSFFLWKNKVKNNKNVFIC